MQKLLGRIGCDFLQHDLWEASDFYQFSVITEDGKPDEKWGETPDVERRHVQLEIQCDLNKSWDVYRLLTTDPDELRYLARALERAADFLEEKE